MKMWENPLEGIINVVKCYARYCKSNKIRLTKLKDIPNGMWIDQFLS